MDLFEIKMPKLGESITEATIIKWLVREGGTVKEDDPLLDIATDKVDSEVPSPVAGRVKKIFYKENDVVPVGEVIALIDTSSTYGEDSKVSFEKSEESDTETEIIKVAGENEASQSHKVKESITKESGSRFYSPLVIQIARKENISLEELDRIKGSGLNGRVTKNDVLAYLKNRGQKVEQMPVIPEKETSTITESPVETVSFAASEGDEIIEMDRIRKLTAEHMIRSKHTSAHVTNILEADVTAIVNWRNKIKDEFEKHEGVKLTYLPVIIEAAIRALRDFPMLNASVDGTRIILKKRINIGIAVALEDTNLIVPVIKNADILNLSGIARELNRLASSARSHKLRPEDIQDGTFTITNFGTFRNTIGTPIINQPQVAILGIGNIEKKPAVLETPDGDVIAIRHKMFLSLTYDHRIINGAYAGAWLKKLADYLESFDTTRTV